MFHLNENYLTLSESYLFSEIAHRVSAHAQAHPQQKLIRMGIGDVTRPLCPCVVSALQSAAAEQGSAATFRGYGPEQGYDFLRERIRAYYAARGVLLEADEIFVSDGAKSDLGNILDLFSRENRVLIPDPVYPVYVDTNRMEGRPIVFADATEENGFLPLPDEALEADLIYLCSPNNPTGAAFTTAQLKAWVDYALDNKAIIIYDAAYEAFITEEDVPRSIFAIEGAKKCAIEICSLSKTAGFTGLRCGYTVVPKELEVVTEDGTVVNVSQIWGRRQGSKFNGVSYPVQCGAAAVFSEEGQKQCAENLEYYKENARIIAKTFDELGIWYSGGKNSPYIWLKCPNGMGSWEFFDYLLTEANVVGTPGAGFGKNGEGYFRLTSFGDRDKTIEAMARIKKLLSK